MKSWSRLTVLALLLAPACAASGSSAKSVSTPDSTVTDSALRQQRLEEIWAHSSAALLEHQQALDEASETDALFPEPAGKVQRTPALYEPLGEQILSFAATTLAQGDELTAYIEQLGEPYAPAGLSGFVVLEGTRGWRGDVALLEHTLEGAKATGGLLNLALSFNVGNGVKAAVTDVSVANTRQFDDRIDLMADRIRDSGVRVLLRIGTELNGPWNDHEPYVFPKAYRKIVQRFRARGADNVAFVWCIAAHGDPDIFERNAAGQYRWFPGEDVIDWYGLDVFSPLHFAGLPGRQRDGADKYYKVSRQVLDHAQRVQKPVIIAECTPQDMPIVSGREDPRGERARVAWKKWFVPFLAMLDTNPHIKAVTMMPVDWRKTTLWSDWGDARIHRNPTLMELWRNELARSCWLHLPDVQGDTTGVLAERPAPDRSPADDA